MKSAVFWILIVANVLLLASFVSRFGKPNAAIAQQARRPGEYAMIPGTVNGSNTGVVYVIDTTNGLLTAITYDSSANQPQLASLPQVNLTEIFAHGAGTGGANNPPNKPRGK